MSAVSLDAAEIRLIMRALSALREAPGEDGLTGDETAVIARISYKLGRATGDAMAAGS